MTPKSTERLPMQPEPRCMGFARKLTAAVSALLLVALFAPFAEAQTSTLLVLRAMPAKAKKGEPFTIQPPLVQSDIAQIKIGGKPAPITAFSPLLKGPHVLQLMVVLDTMEMIGVSGQFDDMKSFFNDLPSNVEIGVGYLLQGKVRIAQPPTTDRTLVGKALHLETPEEATSPKNNNGNPFRCLADLAAHWPNPDPAKLRAVLVFTDGIIRINSTPQGGDQLNPDVDAASNNLQRAGIVPYPFFYMDPIPPDPNRSEGGQLEGQQNFSQLDTDTGGAGLYEGMFAATSFSPLLNKLYGILESEVVVTVDAKGKLGNFTTLDIKSSRPEDIKILGPDKVTIGNTLK